MLPHEAAALAAIDAVYAIPVLYTGAGLVAAPLSAIKSEESAEAFQGAGNTLREVSFEIAQADLPQRPRKTDVIEEVESGHAWRVNDITPRDEIGRWRLIVVKDA
jgi:hypothetical protein